MRFDDWLDPGVSFTIGGREFRVESPSALTVLRWHRLALDDGGADAAGEVRRALGATWGVLNDAGVAEAAVLHAGRAVIANYLDSADRALAVWTMRRDEPAKPPERPTHVHGIELLPEEDPPGTLGPDDPGGGRYNRRTKVRDYYFPPEWAPSYQAKLNPTVKWGDILAAWDAVLIDFDTRGHDLTTEFLDSRPWHWLAVRLAAVLADPTSRTSRYIESRREVDLVGDAVG